MTRWWCVNVQTVYSFPSLFLFFILLTVVLLNLDYFLFNSHNFNYYINYSSGITVIGRWRISAEIPALQEVQRAHGSGGYRAIPSAASSLQSGLPQSRHHRDAHGRAADVGVSAKNKLLLDVLTSTNV